MMTDDFISMVIVAFLKGVMITVILLTCVFTAITLVGFIKKAYKELRGKKDDERRNCFRHL